jgi:MoaA/NifB/PqqE/SkfB family radical SAM enzyme
MSDSCEAREKSGFRLSNWISVARKLSGHNPSYLIFQITSRCNSRCLTGFNWQRLDDPEKNDLRLDEIEKVSTGYGPLLQLTLGGGEPFLRDDIVEICRLFNLQNDVQHITIPTNALRSQETRQLTEQILRRCDLNYLRIMLSLDGIGQEHDRIRGVPGNYEKLQETYRELVDLRKHHSNLGIEIATVLSALNSDSIRNTIDAVAKEFPDIDKQAVVLVRGDARMQASKAVDTETYRSTMEYLRDRNASRRTNLIARLFTAVFNLNTEAVVAHLERGKLPLKCLAGERLLVLTPEGTVYPCELLDRPLGNVRDFDYSIKSILATPQAQKALTFIRSGGCSCTHECAIHASLLLNWQHYPKILWRTLVGR